MPIGPDPATGRPRQRTQGGFATKKAAQAAEAEYLSRQRSGTFLEPASEALGSFLERWLDGGCALLIWPHLER